MSYAVIVINDQYTNDDITYNISWKPTLINPSQPLPPSIDYHITRGHQTSNANQTGTQTNKSVST
eukprot:scaffold93678_cov94-Cyclotella_meneghiniana.AAC.1